MPSEEVNSQEIEDVLADETEVIEPDERRQRNGKHESTEPEMQNEGGEIVELKRPAPAKGKSSERANQGISEASSIIDEAG